MHNYKFYGIILMFDLQEILLLEYSFCKPYKED